MFRLYMPQKVRLLGLNLWHIPYKFSILFFGLKSAYFNGDMMSKEKKEIYLDHISASRTREEAIEAMDGVLREIYGNPHSVHTQGQRAAEVLEEARTNVANLVNAIPEEVIFTSCGSESNNLAIKGIARARKKKSNRIVISAIEHVSINNAVRSLKKEGFEIVTLPVDEYGLVNPDDLTSEIIKGAALVSIIYASTEIGTV